MRLGFVGTGTMGAPMASCLIDAGHQLTLYDVRPDATAALCARGARSAENPAAVARGSEVVFTSLPGPTEVEHAALDPGRGVLTGLQRGGAYIDMTTNSPAVARRVAEACERAGDFIPIVSAHVTSAEFVSIDARFRGEHTQQARLF